ncbi:Integrase [Theobroma cacao]|nr:Integrase [Theobroma cacao]
MVQKIAAVAIGTCDLILPSSLVLELKECYCVPALTRNIISVSYLAKYDDFEFSRKGNCCTVILNDVFYGSATCHGGLYVMDLDNPMLNIDVKKARKDNPNQTYIWHCRLDDHSRFGYVYLMKYKSEAFEKFKEFKVTVKEQTGKSILTLRSDRGGEYLSQDFLDHLTEHGILSQWTPFGTPQHNGVSERRNQTLLDMVHSMMSRANLLISFWGYALETTAYLLNNSIVIFQDFRKCF